MTDTTDTPEYLIVDLPDGRKLAVIDFEFTPGIGGGYYDPPDPPEVSVSQAAWWPQDVTLSAEELEALLDDDDAYTAVLEAAEADYAAEVAAYEDEAWAESMDGDHESALESVYGPND